MFSWLAKCLGFWCKTSGFSRECPHAKGHRFLARPLFSRIYQCYVNGFSVYLSWKHLNMLPSSLLVAYFLGCCLWSKNQIKQWGGAFRPSTRGNPVTYPYPWQTHDNMVLKRLKMIKHAFCFFSPVQHWFNKINHWKQMWMFSAVTQNIPFQVPFIGWTAFVVLKLCCSKWDMWGCKPQLE